MATAWVRIVAECEEYPILIEAMVEDGGTIKKNHVYLGFHGPLRECHPFILLPDGRLDYGADLEDDDRFAATDVFTKRIQEGGSFSIEEFDEETGRSDASVYAIKKIDRL